MWCSPFQQRSVAELLALPLSESAETIRSGLVRLGDGAVDPVSAEVSRTDRSPISYAFCVDVLGINSQRSQAALTRFSPLTIRAAVIDALETLTGIPRPPDAAVERTYGDGGAQTNPG